MPISIQCPQCKRAYRVNDTLAGQKVRCRDCGAAIDIPGEVPELPVEAESKGGIPGVPDLRALFGAGIQQQQRPAASPEINVIDPPDAPARKRRWVRAPGSPLLESIDELIKAAGLLLIVGSVVVWIVHVYKTSPLGLSVSTLAPMGTVLLVIAGVISPLIAFGIDAAVKLIKLPPRQDSYIRTVIPLLLPFSAAMLSGWPGAEDKLSILPSLGWLLCPALFIYFFRAELFEWVVSVGTAALGLGVGMLAASIVASIITSFTGPLYKDLLPVGAWQSLAKGQSPPPPAVAMTNPAVTPETAPAPATPAPVETGTPSFASQPAPEANSTRVALNSNTGANLNPSPELPPVVPAVNPADNGRPPHRAASRNLESPLLTNVIAEPAGLSDVTRVVVPSTPNGTMLVIKNSDTESSVQKWEVNPPAQKADATFPAYPKKPSEFLVGSRGDLLVSLNFFPRNELVITSFDNKIPKKNVPLDIPNSVPSLVGFYDPGHFYLRWDEGSVPSGMAKLQQWNAGAGQALRMTASIPAAPPGGSIVIAPGGKTLAVCEPSGQLALFSMDNGALLRRIKASDLSFNFINMAFSPDGGTIAVYGMVSDVPTISSFRVATGAPIVNVVVSASLTRPRDDPMKHRLIWFQDSAGEDLWLANGRMLFDAASGKRVGKLELDDVLDQQLAANDTLVFELPGARDGSENLVIAHWNDAALHDAVIKAH